jgi:hypothetical protein
MGTVAAQMRAWADLFWREQILIGDLQFMLHRVASAEANATLVLFDPRRRMSSWDTSVPSSQIPRLVRRQRAEILSLSMNTATLAINQSNVVKVSLCSHCSEVCEEADDVLGAGTLVAWVPTATREVLAAAVASGADAVAEASVGSPSSSVASSVPTAALVGLRAADELSALFNRSSSEWASVDAEDHRHRTTFLRRLPTNNTAYYCARLINQTCGGSSEVPVTWVNATREDKLRTMAYVSPWLDARPQAEYCVEWPERTSNFGSGLTSTWESDDGLGAAAIRCAAENTLADLRILHEARLGCKHARSAVRALPAAGE